MLLASASAVTLALVLTVLAAAAATCAWRRWKSRDDNSDGDSSSSDEDDGERLAAEALGDAREETIALIAEQRRRRRQLRRRRAAQSGVFTSLRALFSTGSAESGASTRARRRPSFSFQLKVVERMPAPPKRVHQPHFFPLLQETAQWWEAQCAAAAVLPEPEPLVSVVEPAASVTDAKLLVAV